MANRDFSVWCCERHSGCKWQGFALYQGLSWGKIPHETNIWRKRHDQICKGKLIQISIDDNYKRK